MPVPCSAKSLCTAFLTLCLLALPVFGESYQVEYFVKLDRPQTQTVEIEMVLRGVGGHDEIEVQMPAWRPGRYSIEDFAGTIRSIHAHTGEGERLEMGKTDKATWRIESAGADEVRVGYVLYANQLRLRMAHVDPSHAYLSGSAVFLYHPPYRDESLRVHIEKPEHWRVATGLEPCPSTPNAFVSPDFDILVDSPFEIGEHQLIEFDLEGVPHEIVIWGECEVDEERLAADFKAITRHQAEIFGEIPYERYVFMIHCQPGMGGGTEHWNSTIMGARPESFTNEGLYENFLRLTSHEMFHTWNVKRLRPAGISPYNYQKENYSDLFWVAEGTTSYYDGFTLARIGLTDEQTFLDRIASQVAGHRTRPGRMLQSLAESSFDAWIKFNRPTPDSNNSTISFYGSGALVNLKLDMKIREATGDRESLDTLMRTMYERFPLDGGGFTDDDFRETAEELSGLDLREFWRRFVHGTEDYEVEDAIRRVGLELYLRNARTVAFLGSDFAGGHPARVTRVSSEGPATETGLLVDDEVVSVDGRRFSGGSAESIIRSYSPGDEVEVKFFRWNRLHTLRLTLGEEETGRWTVRKVRNPTPEQRRAYKAWMHRPFDSAAD